MRRPARSESAVRAGRGPSASVLPHKCPAQSCDVVVRAGSLFCAEDWRLIPHEFRAEIWRTWRSGSGRESGEHIVAVVLAIIAVRVIEEEH